jgi:hypothetical protein
MNMLEPIMADPSDHIMANTWRLIFERRSQSSTTGHAATSTDFALLEEILPEYRLIGLCLAEEKKVRPN